VWRSDGLLAGKHLWFTSGIPKRMTS
jgi:hypothetical protein